MDKPVIILGANTIGISAKEAFESNDVIVYGFLDDDKGREGEQIGEVGILGEVNDSTYFDLIGKDCEAFVATEEIELRRNLVDSLVEQRKTMPVNALHNSAQFSSSSEIGHGNFVGEGVILGSNVKIGNHLIIHMGAIINTESKLGDFVQVGAGSIINSKVEIADEVFIGSGVVIVSGVKIGKGARIGAGSVVIGNIKESATVFGNPAKAID